MRLVSRHNYSNKRVHLKSLKYYDMEVKTLGLASKRLKSKQSCNIWSISLKKLAKSMYIMVLQCSVQYEIVFQYTAQHYSKNKRRESLSIFCEIWKFSFTLFWQKFRESHGFTKELISRNIFSVRANFLFSHTVHSTAQKNYVENIVSPENYSVKSIYSRRLIVKVGFTKFLRNWWQ